MSLSMSSLLDVFSVTKMLWPQDKLPKVTINYSGRYLCRMATEFEKKVKEFWLNISGKIK